MKLTDLGFEGRSFQGTGDLQSGSPSGSNSLCFFFFLGLVKQQTNKQLINSTQLVCWLFKAWRIGPVFSGISTDFGW